MAETAAGRKPHASRRIPKQCAQPQLSSWTLALRAEHSDAETGAQLFGEQFTRPVCGQSVEFEHMATGLNSCVQYSTCILGLVALSCVQHVNLLVS